MKFDKEFVGKLKDFGTGLGILLLGVLIVSVSWMIISTLISVIASILFFLVNLILWLIPTLGIIIILAIVGGFCYGYWTDWQFLEDLDW
ncbi:hypothetical protein LCGC14_1421120 [marine sediment metagenome]|uniref:Uncharacterized protein n=1 Tax=marine sediment metagenome TaxID=412755 RepID=A0A0F9JR55_9ZZZZ